MKLFFKTSIENTLKLFINLLHRSNIGRYVLDIINKHIIKRKKKVFYKNLNLTFYVPNRLSYYRADSFSSKEPETLSWIDNFDTKSTFWDIGANIGLYSCYAAKKKNCNVYAFEPSIFNLEWLGKNIHLNNLVDNITVISIPLTSSLSKNTLKFSTTEWSGALSTFGENYGHDGKNIKEIFKFSTIGLSMNDIKQVLQVPQPDYVKIDVDGIEHLIIEGGAKVLLNTKEILVEVNESFDEQKNNCNKYLKQLGFNLKEKKRSELFKKDKHFSSLYNQIWVKQK
jgi:FkbM family methyltransferase